jgi:hypothetical protein
MPHLVDILLPLYDNDGQPLARDLLRQVAAELTDRFGGVTAHTRAPAEGLWRDEADRTTRDDVVIYEVVVDEVDRDWWSEYRRTLEGRFRQRQVLIRARPIEVL